MAKKQVKMQVAASCGTACGSGDGNKINVGCLLRHSLWCRRQVDLN